MQKVQDEIKKGVNINMKDDRGWIPLHYAAEKGNWNGFYFASKNRKFKTLSVHDLIKFPWFFKLGHDNVAEVLLTNGAIVNTKDNSDQTPLHYAAELVNLID